MFVDQIAVGGVAYGANPPQSVNLQSGAIWQPGVTPGVNAGEYLVRLGPQSVAQWYDLNLGIWRMLEAGPTSHPIFLICDGNVRVINASGTIQGVNITNAGTLYKTGDTVTFAAPAAGTPSRTAKGTLIVGGSLSFAVTSGGTGYSNPMFLIQPPQLCGGTVGQCLPATILSCTLTSGVISAPTGGFAGAGYATAPTVTVIDAVPSGVTPGSGAVITATVGGSGTCTGVIMNDPGAGYDGTHIPAVTFTSATGSNAAGTALPNMACKSITVGGTNTSYSASVELQSSLGAATAIANIWDEPVLPRGIVASAGESAGAVGTPIIEDAGFGFQTVPLVKQVGNATADGSVNATFVAVVGGVNNILQYWQMS